MPRWAKGDEVVSRMIAAGDLQKVQGGQADGEAWLGRARPTTRGGHLAGDEASRAQFGDAFRSFRALRMRRHELEYPDYPDEPVEEEEAADAVSAATEIIKAAESLLPHLGFFV